MTEYVLGTTDHELRRLTLQHEVWRPVIDGFLDRLGLSSGMRCLDLGCGPGLLATDLLARVGPGGAVDGVDASERWIEYIGAQAPRPGFSVRQGEIQRVELEPERPAGGQGPEVGTPTEMLACDERHNDAWKEADERGRLGRCDCGHVPARWQGVDEHRINRKGRLRSQSSSR